MAPALAMQAISHSSRQVARQHRRARRLDAAAPVHDGVNHRLKRGHGYLPSGGWPRAGGEASGPRASVALGAAIVALGKQSTNRGSKRRPARHPGLARRGRLRGCSRLPW